ncbi:MAG: energy-coupling factor transporter transmembrane component T, partial [Clostridia bacterium]|nr:energy-coupling factor transporter transmembrane component T [Clostridia bacterium]
MNEFSKYHPIVNFAYFLCVLGFSMVFMHPVTLAISLTVGFIYSVMLNGKKAIKFNLLYMIPLVLITALINPAFNHEGMTILTYLPSCNPLTLESILYGIASAIMLWSVICHFSCFNKIMTSDKFVYLFGKIVPSLSLILSMVLRFVPKFKSQIQTVSNAQRCVGRDVSQGNIVDRAKNGIKILSIMITWSLENAIDTADSMKSRGYGLPNRTAYSNFRFNKRDVWLLLYIIVLSAYIIAKSIKGGLYFKYFPIIKGNFDISVILAYLLLFICPI